MTTLTTTLTRKNKRKKEERYRELSRSEDTLIQLRRFIRVMQLYKGLARWMCIIERTFLPVEEQQKMWMETFKFIEDDDFKNAKEDLKRLAELNELAAKEMEEVIGPIMKKEIAEREKDLR
jgi:hypothetical protein